MSGDIPNSRESTLIGLPLVCYQHTETPASPAHILETTITDQQIIDLFETANHRARAQTEIERWGTGVNWTDFHHDGTWHETY